MAKIFVVREEIKKIKFKFTKSCFFSVLFTGFLIRNILSNSEEKFRIIFEAFIMVVNIILAIDWGTQIIQLTNNPYIEIKNSDIILKKRWMLKAIINTKSILKIKIQNTVIIIIDEKNNEFKIETQYISKKDKEKLRNFILSSSNSKVEFEEGVEVWAKGY